MSIPIRIGTGDQTVGRFGGGAPVGICPPDPSDFTRHFVTIPLVIEPPLHASVFLSFDFEQMLDTMGQLGKGQGLIQVVAHPPVSAMSDDFPSEFPPYALILAEPTDDIETDSGNEVIVSSHKLGGRPYFMHHEPSLVQAVEQLWPMGFVHVLQMDFPGIQDPPFEEDWPFADGVFHLLGKAPFLADDWCWFWEC